MKATFSSIMILTVFFLFSSCTTTSHINEKLILGSWKSNKVISFNSTAIESNDAPKSDKSSEINLDAETVKTQKKDSGTPEDPVALVKELTRKGYLGSIASYFPEFKYKLSFSPDKTAVVVTSQKHLDGNWKMNKTGTKITITGKEIKPKITLLLTKVDTSSMILADKMVSGEFVISYQKGK